MLCCCLEGRVSGVEGVLEGSELGRRTYVAIVLIEGEIMQDGSGGIWLVEGVSDFLCGKYIKQ